MIHNDNTNTWQGEEISLHSVQPIHADQDSIKNVLMPARTIARKMADQYDESFSKNNLEVPQAPVQPETKLMPRGLDSIEANDQDSEDLHEPSRYVRRLNGALTTANNNNEAEQIHAPPFIAPKEGQGLGLLSDIKQVLSLPVPLGTDELLTKQIEAAREVLGVAVPSSVQETTPTVAGQPPTFERSEEMKAAFMRALEAPVLSTPANIAIVIPQLRDDVTSINPLSRLHKIIKTKDEATPTEDSIASAPITLSAPAVVVHPNGQPVQAPEIKHNYQISKFSYNSRPTSSNLSGGGLFGPDTAIATSESLEKPFFVEDTINSTKK